MITLTINTRIDGEWEFKNPTIQGSKYTDLTITEKKDVNGVYESQCEDHKTCNSYQSQTDCETLAGIADYGNCDWVTNDDGESTCNLAQTCNQRFEITIKVTDQTCGNPSDDELHLRFDIYSTLDHTPTK